MSTGGGDVCSAVPADLTAYATRGTLDALSLISTSATVRTALDRLARSHPDPSLLPAVPPLGEDLLTFASNKLVTDSWVGMVGLAFEAAGSHVSTARLNATLDLMGVSPQPAPSSAPWQLAPVTREVSYWLARMIGTKAASADRLTAAIAKALAAYSGDLSIGVRGATGEGALLRFLQQAGSSALDLNELPTVGLGKNFNLLDVASDDGLFSVKTSLARNWVSAYERWFTQLVNGLPMSRLDRATNELLANETVLRDAGAWPAGLDADVRSIQAFIMEQGRLAIPGDQVAAVRQAILQKALDIPARYGLDSTDPSAIDRLLQRVVSSGIDSGDVGRIEQFLRDLGGAATTLTDATKGILSPISQFLNTPFARGAGKVLRVGGDALNVAGDVMMLVSPSQNALGGAGTERAMAGINLAGIGISGGASLTATLLGANAVADWIPGVGEAVMLGTAAYFVGDLVYQNWGTISHAAGAVVHDVGNVAHKAFSAVGNAVSSGLSAIGSLF